MSDARRNETDADDVRSPGWEEAVAARARRGELTRADGDAAEPLAEDDDSTGILGRYARWQWRDFWQRRGGWLTLGALLGVSLLVVLARLALGTNGQVGGPVIAAQNAAIVRAQVAGLATTLLTLGGAAAALIGVGGLVSRERERGLQRFLFAKPVRPVRYYLQAFAINSGGALLVFAGAVLLTAAILGSVVPVASILVTGFSAYVLTAGVTFLASTLIRFDAPVAAAWLLAGFPVYALGEVGLPGARVLAWLFPQGPAAALARWATGLGPAAQAVGTLGLGTVLVAALVVAYGLLALAGGVAVLRRRPIST
ncbi:hypothetical protein tb265_07820 [Gemmatimonadetes bacterium T265]|nr:hypothetical protein tb265_07820 [Gemmatimonadetes bacterium T265]